MKSKLIILILINFILFRIIKGDIKNNETFVLFYFGGQPSSWYKEISLSLYEGNIVYRNSINRIDNYLKDNYFNGVSMFGRLTSLTSEEANNIQMDQFFVHANWFMFLVSLNEVYKSEAIEPTVILGISCGEIASSYCAGLIDFETACFLVYNRAIIDTKASNHYPNSTMITMYNLTTSEFNTVFKRKYPHVEISIIVSPIIQKLFCTGGKIECQEFINEITALGYQFTTEQYATSFHTSVMDYIKSDALTLNFPSSKQRVPVYSASINKFINKFDSKYLFKNLRNQIDLTNAFEMILNYADKVRYNKVVILELSQSTTSSAIKQIINYSKCSNKFIKNPNSIIISCPTYTGMMNLTNFNQTINNIKINI